MESEIDGHGDMASRVDYHWHSVSLSEGLNSRIFGGEVISDDEVWEEKYETPVDASDYRLKGHCSYNESAFKRDKVRHYGNV